MKSCAVAVIGHVDHGKTSLVRALTGIETDRLKEEKERGMSIALGFAHRVYPSGNIDFIDVPGHEDFIRTMVAGAAGACAALLVVSAVEGIARQTIEHLEIATLLGITTGVVAVTKADLLAHSEWSNREMSIRAAIAATGLKGQPIVFCSSATGEGLDVLIVTSMICCAVRLNRHGFLASSCLWTGFSVRLEWEQWLRARCSGPGLNGVRTRLWPRWADR
jgi:selenocysteine-specific elongation factor